jgi:hypothetical protein
MMIEKQFPSVGELARRKKEVVCPAAKESSDERKSGLRLSGLSASGAAVADAAS